MEGGEWVDLSDVPLIADVTWLHAQTQNGGEIASVTRHSWERVDLGALADDPPAPPELGGLGIAYAGARHVFSGPQESAKTLAAYALGLEVLRADGVFCLLDFEMGRWDARNRLRELGATDDELSQIVYYEPEGRMPLAVSHEVIGIVGERPAVVVIDAAAGAFAYEELDDNKRMDVERFATRYVEPFRRAKIATVLLDHVVKSSEARGNYAIGSERKVGQTDVHLGFSVIHAIKRGGTGLYKVTTHKDRGGFLKRGKLCDFELSSDTETHHLTWSFKVAVEVDEDHPFRPTGIMEKVSKYLEHQSEAVTMQSVKDMVTGRAEYLVLAVDLLVKEEYVTETSGSRDARLLTLQRSYREISDPFLTHSRPVPGTGEVDETTRSPFPVSKTGTGTERPRPEKNGSTRSRSNQSLESFDETCRKCGEGFNRGTGNRGDLCGTCVRDELSE